MAIAFIALLNLVHYNYQTETLLSELRRLEHQRPNNTTSLPKKEDSILPDSTLSSHQQKAQIQRFYWPDASNNPLVSKLYALMHPSKCDSPNTKYMIWRSLRQNEKDTRGLSAWGHTGTWMLLHG